MTLTQQFIIIALLPVSFLGMIVYIWWSDVPRRRVLVRWIVTLVAAAIWSSSVLRFYGGSSLPTLLVRTWGNIGNYTFSLTALAVLITTLPHLNVDSRRGQVAITLSIILWLASLALDPAVWPYRIPSFMLAGQTVGHFDIWAAVWIAGWLLPILAAWLLTQQSRAGYATSLYHNQVNYWLLVLVLFFTGGVLASIRQPGQPMWQELGVLFVILAAFTGTVSIANSQLADLQLSVRQILSRLSGTLILFGLTWAALNVIVQGVTNLPTNTNRNLLLILAAALFAGLFTIIYRLVNALTQRLFVPSLARREVAMARYTNAVGNLPEPAHLGKLFLRIIQSNLSVDDAWLFTAEDGAEGALILRPLASLGALQPETANFKGNSPFVEHLRREAFPLAQYDIDALDTFDDMPASEKDLLTTWQRVLYVPLHAGDRLVGVLMLGERSTGESYVRRDFELLGALADQISPLLAQAHNLASLHRINDHLFRQNQQLTRHNTHLEALSKLNTRFLTTISPDLRQPLTIISSQLDQLQNEVAEDEAQRLLVADLFQQINKLKEAIDKLIAASSHLLGRDELSFKPVRLDEITQRAIRNLRTMAEARQVTIEFEPDPSLLPVMGDERQLREAIQHLLHNAIKFNKIGGVVQLEYAKSNGHVCFHITDTGVGIPEERLETIWSDAGGAGSGLVLTDYIVSAHGGYLKAQSKHGEGSRFSLFLPAILESEE